MSLFLCTVCTVLKPKTLFYVHCKCYTMLTQVRNHQTMFNIVIAAVFSFALGIPQYKLHPEFLLNTRREVFTNTSLLVFTHPRQYDTAEAKQGHNMVCIISLKVIPIFWTYYLYLVLVYASSNLSLALIPRFSLTRCM